MTEPATDPRDASDITAALKHLNNLCDFAYERGYHEHGYDPVKTVASEIERLERDNAELYRLLQEQTNLALRAAAGACRCGWCSDCLRRERGAQQPLHRGLDCGWSPRGTL